MVHRFRDRSDACEAFLGEVDLALHQADDLGELPEIIDLRGSQRVIFEERHDPFGQVTQPPDDEPEHVFPVIIAPSVDGDRSASEERFEIM